METRCYASDGSYGCVEVASTQDSLNRITGQRQRREASIQKKLHPALPEILTVFRAAEKEWKILKESDRTPEKRGEIERRLDEKLEAIDRKYSGPVQAPKGTFGVEAAFREKTLASQSESAAVAEYLHWNRHKTSFGKDVRGMQDKDYAASTRVQRTLHDFEMLRCNQGPVKPFKGGREGTDHWDFFLVGWGLGLEKLSPEELADFCDKHCLCGSDNHNPDNLKQQRIRFKKALKSSMSASENIAKPEKKS